MRNLHKLRSEASYARSDRRHGGGKYAREAARAYNRALRRYGKTLAKTEG